MCKLVPVHQNLWLQAAATHDRTLQYFAYQYPQNLGFHADLKIFMSRTSRYIRYGDSWQKIRYHNTIRGRQRHQSPLIIPTITTSRRRSVSLRTVCEDKIDRERKKQRKKIDSSSNRTHQCSSGNTPLRSTVRSLRKKRVTSSVVHY